MKEREYILCAANWYDDGIEHIHRPINIKTGLVICGYRHHNIIHDYCKLTNSKIGENCIQGFMTSKNRFVDRKEGAIIAMSSRQVERQIHTLYSEDLY